MIIIEFLGWATAALTIMTYAMKTMLPLRVLALSSSVASISYSLALGLWPILLMGLILLPFNAWRLWEILRLRRQVVTRKKHRANFSIIESYGTPIDLAEGTPVFRRGDAADALYYITSGTVRLQEVGVELGAGNILGEIGFFTDAEARTATAICMERTRLFMLTETQFLQLQFQDPSFGMAVMRTVTRRLVDGMARNPAVYQGLVSPLDRQ